MITDNKPSDAVRAATDVLTCVDDAEELRQEHQAQPLIERFVSLASQGGASAWDAIDIGVEHPSPELDQALVGLLAVKDKGVRWAAARVAAGRPLPGAYEGLITCSSDRSLDIRLEAITALGVLGDPRARERLKKCLKDPDVAAEAATALGALRDPTILPVLAKAARGPVEGTRVAAVRALASIGGEEASLMVVPCLDDESDVVRGEAALALGRLGFRAAVPKLLSRLAALPRWSNARWWICQTLGALGDTNAIDPLLSIASDPTERDLHAFAATALGKLGDRRALEVLQSLQESRDEDVRKAAREAVTALEGGAAELQGD